MASVRLDAVVAGELLDCLELLCGWIDEDRKALDDRLWRYIPAGGSIGELRDDLRRFADHLAPARDIDEEPWP